jgi:hypothetical protein
MLKLWNTRLLGGKSFISPCNNANALQEKKPVKTSYTKIRRCMAIVLLVKTFYTQITIRYNMTTENKIQSKEVMS